jgi:hypothetical protein
VTSGTGDGPTLGQDRTDHRAPAERLLDLFVFGPAGLAITAAEEFPRLVEKGRHRVEGQVHTARLVGQFALQMGRRQVGQVLERLTSRPDAQHAPPRRAGFQAPSAATAAPPGGDGVREPVKDLPTVGTSEGNGSGPVNALAIPGYDSLSASQVVQRLGGLSRGELEDVRSHEMAHRHRRTILHRIDQLLDGPDDGQH